MREDKLKKNIEYALVALPVWPRVSAAPGLGTSCPAQLIAVFHGKRDKQKEKEREEEESRENKETSKYVLVEPICPLVLRDTVDAHVGLIPLLGRGRQRCCANLHRTCSSSSRDEKV